ncbi:MAG: DNA methyltransferase [Thermoguttaceae bacterium]
MARCNGHPLGSGELHGLLNEVKKEQRRRAAAGFSQQSNDDGDILVGDLGVLWERLKDAEADIFLTDPPYAEVALYERLAELAAAKLKPGGLCLAYTGQCRLPEVMAAMAKYLTYWWEFGIEFAGAHCAIYPKHIQNAWKPILAYGKPPLQPAPEWLSDLLQGGGRDKEHHDWGQDQSEVEYLLEKLTQSGELVVEPFAGGGSVPAAAKKMGRRWIATEIDETTALIARKRLSEVKK